jgi:hypothetical protein
MFYQLLKSETLCFLTPQLCAIKKLIPKAAQKPQHPALVSVALSVVVKRRGEQVCEIAI